MFETTLDQIYFPLCPPPLPAAIGAYAFDDELMTGNAEIVFARYRFAQFQ